MPSARRTDARRLVVQVDWVEGVAERIREHASGGVVRLRDRVFATNAVGLADADFRRHRHERRVFEAGETAEESVHAQHRRASAQVRLRPQVSRRAVGIIDVVGRVATALQEVVESPARVIRTEAPGGQRLGERALQSRTIQPIDVCARFERVDERARLAHGGPFTREARKRDHGGIARAVHDLPRTNRARVTDRHDREIPEAVREDSRRRRGMVMEPHARLRQRLLGQCDIERHVDRDLVLPVRRARRLAEVRERAARKGDAVRDQLIADAVNHLLAPSVKQAREVDAAARHRAADLEALLDDDGLRTRPRTLQGGRHAGRAAAHDHDVAVFIRQHPGLRHRQATPGQAQDDAIPHPRPSVTMHAVSFLKFGLPTRRPAASPAGSHRP